MNSSICMAATSFDVEKQIAFCVVTEVFIICFFVGSK